MNNRFFMLITVVGCIVLFCGCRNHIKNFDTTMTDYERKVISDVNIIHVLEKDVENGSLRLRFTGNRENEVKVFEIHNTSSRYTPYQAWRELYEVPVGLIVFPVGLFSHIINIFSFGIFPYQWCWNMDCYGLAALNPFMNTESSTRFEDEPIRSKRDLVDTKNEISDYLKSNTNVLFKLGNREKNKLTDSAGIVVIDLLDVKGDSLLFNNYDREVKIYVGQMPKPAYTWIVPRQLKNRIKQAREIIQNYETNPTPEKLYKNVIKLSELKFSKVSYWLEQKELKKHGKKFAEKFYALDK